MGRAGHDLAGNMTGLPQPASPDNGFVCTYDAWNRLVGVVDATTSQTVAQYQYDGRGYRTVAETYASGVLNEARDFYYSDQWQVVEECVGQPTADRQFVWGLRYVDDLLLRDRDTIGVGALDERLYGLQDPNWNVTSLTDPTGVPVECYRYSAYGCADVPYRGVLFDRLVLRATRRRSTAATVGTRLRGRTRLATVCYGPTLVTGTAGTPSDTGGGTSICIDTSTAARWPIPTPPAIKCTLTRAWSVRLRRKRRRSGVSGLRRALRRRRVHKRSRPRFRRRPPRWGQRSSLHKRRTVLPSMLNTRRPRKYVGNAASDGRRISSARARRLAYSTANFACFAAAVAGRTAYIASGCDFILYNNYATHVGQLLNKTGASDRCAMSMANNCY